jgi:hypothetical protein
VSTRLLLESALDRDDSPHSGGEANTNQVVHFYMYFFDGYSKKIARNLITIVDGGAQETEATLLYRIESFDKSETCRDFYTGKASVSDPYTNFVFQNANNNMEDLLHLRKFSYLILSEEYEDFKFKP